MKPQRSFVAERALARHCPDLLRARTPSADLEAGLALLGERLARALAAPLGRLTGADSPAITQAAPRCVTMADMTAAAPPLAANCLLTAGPAHVPVLATFGGDIVMSLLDRAFGGAGSTAQHLPDAFPVSAQLLIDRLETLIAQALAEACNCAAQPLRREGSLARLNAFPAEQLLWLLDLAIAGAGPAPWVLTLAFPAETMAALLGEGCGESPRAVQPASATSEPFSDLPIDLKAVLVDMAMPMALLAGLTPGQVLPVSVARKVPLKAGGVTIAHGIVGALDDRVALRLIQAF